ncbi:Beta-propeller repeat protein [Hyella patelloides LEGE 07179]|uniref:Beta-propeller repeat protein n=1 Tax=Hyella patelloides LEGE 07179 TaxID=945734 RepID=A0A563VK82_9CYAN|nr:SBBP repeat-containing protein [Hyella patelloides]VEP11906.1 Beta-propeller repeat protein [Hyella patelloides LEGE 07179]
MNEKLDLIEIIDDENITPGEPIADEIVEEVLVEDSSLSLTESTEEFVEVFESSDVTDEEQEEAIEEIIEEEIDAPISEELQRILIAFFTDLSIAGSPGSDAFQFGSRGTNIISGREGNDILLGVDPELDLPGQNIDIFTGGSERDSFILGDRNKPYYDDGNDSTTGDNSVAIISDFNPEEDIIQLHGSPEDYTLVDFGDLGEEETGTAIFLKGATNDELIGSLDNVSGLNLNANYFQFVDGSAQQPVLELIEQFGTEGIDLSFSVANAKDRSNSLLVTGYTSGSLGIRDRGALDGFLTRYNNQGIEQWTRQIGTRSNDNSYGVDTDNAGNAYLLSRTNGRLAGANAGIGNDVVLGKYNRRGRQIWQVQFGDFTLDNPFVDPRVNSSGDVVIAGYTGGDLGGPNAGTGIIPGADSWIAKYDSNGNQQWIEQFGTSGGDETFGLDVDSEDNIYTTGWTTGDLGGSNSGIYDIWLAKYDSNGNQQWIEQFGTNDFDWSWDVATDLNDDIYITGWTLGNLEGTNAGSYDIWVAKYDSEGNQLRLDQFGTGGDDAALGIDVDELGNYYLTGYTNGDLTGEGSAGSYDAWVAKYDSNGNQLWIEQFGSYGIDNAYEVSVSGGDVFVTGTTNGSLGSTNAGSFDAWVAQFSAEDGTLLDF